MSVGVTKAVIMLSRFSATGQFIEHVEVAQSSASRRAGFQSMESVENTV